MLKVAPKVSIETHKAAAPTNSLQTSLGEQLEVSCLIEAFPKPNTYWTKSRRKSAVAAPEEGGEEVAAADGEEERPAAFERRAILRPRLETGAELIFEPPREAYQQLYALNNNSQHNRRFAEDRRHATEGNFLAGEDSQKHNWRRRAEPTRGSVSVKQTAVNSYTYKLTMIIARTQPDDFGEYVCVASNSIGTAEARVLVKSK